MNKNFYIVIAIRLSNIVLTKNCDTGSNKGEDVVKQCVSISNCLEIEETGIKRRDPSFLCGEEKMTPPPKF